MNAIKDSIKSGRTVVGTTVTPNVDVSILADAGYDFLLFDTQHSAWEIKQLQPSIQTMRGKQAAPLVRVAANQAYQICFALDAGARGIVVPMVNTSAEAEAAVRACRYFPLGNRSNAGVRGEWGEFKNYRACSRFFAWCEQRGLTLGAIRPHDVATYIEQLQAAGASAPSVKQQLAAVRMLFDWLVVGQVVPHNPAAAVRGPKHVVKTGSTPVLEGEEWRKLLDSIPVTTLRDLRDRALIATLTYSFARVSAALKMKVEDLRPRGAGWTIRLHEKGGKQHAMPCHHALAEALHAYINAAGIAEDRKGFLFRTASGHNGTVLSGKPMSQPDAWRMIRRRAAAAGIAAEIGCHTFRATGITAYLSNGGALEHAQEMAAHESPRTTKLYDRTKERLTQDEVERIRF